MVEDVNDIDDLIGKLLAGEASAEEQLRLQQWVAQNAANEQYYHQIKTIFDTAAANPVRMQFDTDAAWQKMRGRLSKKSEPTGRVISLWPSLRIAAGIVLILAAGFFAYRWFSQPVQHFEAAADRTTLLDTLPDGSSAFLNKRSSISYEYNPREKTRKVKLKGESYFEVKHEEEKPFIIEAEEVLVRDIGTAFNVRAYPESDTVEVIVQSGEVQIYTVQNQGLFLKAGETGIYTKR